MQTYKYVIVGGGIAGTTAAETIRKTDPTAKIAIISAEPYPLYSRVLLSKPNFLLGKQPFDTVWLKNQEWYDSNNIHLFKGLRATHLDPVHKAITLSDGDVLSYEKLLLATGSRSRTWDIPGADKKGVIYLRNLDDAKMFSEAMLENKKHAVTIGSACVSFEMIEILLSQGARVTEVMREHYFFEPQLSSEEASIIESDLIDRGVEIIREMEVEEVLGNDAVEGVRLKDGRTISCDMILALIGVVFELEWLQSSGLKIHKGILANEYLETNLPDVWTAGDIAECNDIALGEVVIMGNWMSAREQGVVAAKNMTGTKTVFEQVSFHTSHGFGYTIGFTGDVRPLLPDRTVIHRKTLEPKSYCRFILRNNLVIGGTVVNHQDLLGIITNLIKHHVDVSEHLEHLADPNFDLKTLVPAH